MGELVNSVNKIAPCGLYCGNCGKFKNQKCPSCPSFEEGQAPNWCKIRPCTYEKGYKTCAECTDWRDCKIRDNFMSKVYGFIFRSNRNKMLSFIEENGLEEYAELMKNSGSMRLPKL